MPRFLRALKIVFLGLIALTILAGLLWANTTYAHRNPGEKSFFVPWLALRTFLQYGDSPYSDPATQRAQVVYYGELVQEGKDPLRLSLPFPALFLYFPFALIPDYALARGFFMTCLEAALAAMGYLALNLSGMKPKLPLVILLMLFSLTWVHGYLPLTSSNGVIVVALAAGMILWALREGNDELAGALMVVLLFKPAVTAVFLGYIGWYAISHRRGRILAGFLMTLVILLTASFFFQPDWIVPFLRGMISHNRFNPVATLGGFFTSWSPAIGMRSALAITGLLLVMLVFEWRAARKKEFRHFLWTSSLSMAVFPLMGFPVSTQDYCFLFLPLIFLLSILVERWAKPGGWILHTVLLSIPFLGLWALEAARQAAGVTHSSQQILALPVLLLIGLYWIRWWAVSPPRTWTESLQ